MKPDKRIKRVTERIEYTIVRTRDKACSQYESITGSTKRDNNICGTCKNIALARWDTEAPAKLGICSYLVDDNYRTWHEDVTNRKRLAWEKREAILKEMQEKKISANIC